MFASLIRLCVKYGEFRVQLTWHSHSPVSFFVPLETLCATSTDGDSVLATYKTEKIFFLRFHNNFKSNLKLSRASKTAQYRLILMLLDIIPTPKRKLTTFLVSTILSPCVFSLQQNFELLTIQSINFIRSFFSPFQSFFFIFFHILTPSIRSSVQKKKKISTRQKNYSRREQKKITTTRKYFSASKFSNGSSLTTIYWR